MRKMSNVSSQHKSPLFFTSIKNLYSFPGRNTSKHTYSDVRHHTEIETKYVEERTVGFNSHLSLLFGKIHDVSTGEGSTVLTPSNFLWKTKRSIV